MTITTSATCAHCSGPFTYERVKKERKYCSIKCRDTALAPNRRAAQAKYDARARANPNSRRNKWLSENGEAIAKNQRRYYEKNREKVIAKARQCDVENPEAARARKARYAATPRGMDKALEGTHRRRARVKGARGTHTREQFRKLVAFYENKCLCCRDEFPTARLEEDHVVPIAMGGNNTIYNLQPLCQPCNRRKADKHQDFRPTWENYL